MELKIKEITMEIGNVYMGEHYNETGIFIVNNSEVMWINKAMNLCVFICFKHEISHLLSEDVENETIIEDKNTVTEEFALKMMAISLNKEKFKEL